MRGVDVRHRPVAVIPSFFSSWRYLAYFENEDARGQHGDIPLRGMYGFGFTEAEAIRNLLEQVA